MEASHWTQCISALEAELPEQQFNTWVRPLQVLEGAGALKLLAPNRFVVDWVNANLLPRIGELLRDQSNGDIPVVTVEVGSRAAAPPAPPSRPVPLRPRRADGLVVGARLQADFTFSTFVEGKSKRITHEEEQPLEEEKPLSTKERGTLLTIIAALAREAKIDISKPSKAADLIADMTQRLGAPVAKRTIEEKLKLVDDAVERRAQS